ncbi:MAG: response regulator [Candidatus Omnitrophota bacterium]|jgi:DNA-binding response OmpR family regulator|nr:MAG: response regulator [Candidatus Omnitrophota bacterium]
MKNERRILLVDDNPQYRSAVTRNLTLAGYRVIEAGDSVEGMEKVQKDNPQIVITDLDMRTHDEGLQFIRDVKRQYPHLPIIMISAVGTFDEGALARQYGAMFVLSKSRIEEEINTLYQRLDSIYEHFQRLRYLQDQLEDLLQKDNVNVDQLRRELDTLLNDQHLDTGLKSQVYELVDRLERHQNKFIRPLEGLDLESALQSVLTNLPEAKDLDPETQTMLSVAESMQLSSSHANLSIARNVSFSYSFAVENEVKLRIGRKVNRLLSNEKVLELANDLYDSALGNLDIFFNQYLIRTIQQSDLELNSDITRQVLERIIKHGSKYKPDGLKALGVILFCWGQNHAFTNRKGKVQITNPLGIKGISEAMTTELAGKLILLQHLRNPFIHPEFNEREKTESVRKTAFLCLAIVSKVV